MSPQPTRKPRNGEVAEVMSDKELSKAGQSAEVAIPTPQFETQDLQALKDWSDLDAFVAKYGIETLPADQVLGDGFAILNDKRKLVGVRMMILEWRHNSGEKTKGTGGFTSMRVVAMADNGSLLKYIVNDGSQGIHKQLTDFSADRKVMSGLFVKNGLRVSDYEVEVDDGHGGTVTKDASTYYLDTSA